MTKLEIQDVMEEINGNIIYYKDDIELKRLISPLLGISSMTQRKVVPKKCVVTFLSYHCKDENGYMDYNKLSKLLTLFQRKVIVV